jgi:hypothetical protein
MSWSVGANLGNSMIIEMYGNNIRVSQGFQDCQLLASLAESQQEGGSLAIRLQHMTFLEA